VLTKILFTLLVIIAVAVIFRHKTRARTGVDRQRPPRAAEGGIRSSTVIYAIGALIVVLSALLFVLHWQDQHQIVNIEVTGSGGNTIAYQAYKKSIEGRKFVTLDGREVTLGDNDRVEMTSPE